MIGLVRSGPLEPIHPPLSSPLAEVAREAKALGEIKLDIEFNVSATNKGNIGVALFATSFTPVANIRRVLSKSAPFFRELLYRLPFGMYHPIDVVEISYPIDEWYNELLGAFLAAHDRTPRPGELTDFAHDNGTTTPADLIRAFTWPTGGERWQTLNAQARDGCKGGEAARALKAAALAFMRLNEIVVTGDCDFYLEVEDSSVHSPPVILTWNDPADTYAQMAQEVFLDDLGMQFNSSMVYHEAYVLPASGSSIRLLKDAWSKLERLLEAMLSWEEDPRDEC